jgi:hypothetical protein
VLTEATKHVMNLIKGSLQESIEEQFGEEPLTEGHPLQMNKYLKNKSTKKVVKKNL